MPSIYIKDVDQNKFVKLKAFQGEKGEKGDKGDKGDNYVITSKDYEKIEEQVKEDIQPLIDDVIETSENALDVAESAESIARGKSQAIVFDTFEDLEAWVKDETNKGIGLIGDNLYIKQMWIDEEAGIRQPDYWITEVLEEPNELGYYYNISDLGVEHPDLTNLVKNTDYATTSNAGIVRLKDAFGIGISATNDNCIFIRSATTTEIDTRKNNYKPIVPSTLDYAVKSALNNGIITYDEETETLSITI